MNLASKMSIQIASLLVVTGLLAVGCSDDSGGGNGSGGGVTGAQIPAAKPPVEKATPSDWADVDTSSSSLKVAGADLGIASEGGCNVEGDDASDGEVGGFCIPNFKYRIYETGTANPLDILEGVDDRMSGVNTRSQEGNGKKCLNDEPKEITITVNNISGEDKTFYLQCIEDVDSGYIAFGKNDDKYYLIENTGSATATAAIITTIDGSDDPMVEAFSTVGRNNNPFDEGSYGAMTVSANPEDGTYEFTVAGVGLGLCGAHLMANENFLFAQVSEESSGGDCEATSDSICLNKSDLTEADDQTSCDDIDSDNFTVTSLGREETAGTSVTWDASVDITANLELGGGSDDGIHYFPSKAELENLGLRDFSEEADAE